MMKSFKRPGMCPISDLQTGEKAGKFYLSPDGDMNSRCHLV